MEYVIGYILLALISYVIFTLFDKTHNVKTLLFAAAVFPLVWLMVLILLPSQIRKIKSKKKPYRMSCMICPDEDTNKCKACRDKGSV